MSSKLFTYTTDAEVGVIIARFQVPELHEGHKELIEAIMSVHKKVIILLGTAPVRVTRRNPLDYITRELMLKEHFPTLSIHPIKDRPNDKDWSEAIDELIDATVGGTSVVLYGSRDSFIPHYSGKHTTIELPDTQQLSGTEIRAKCSKEIRSEEAFRRGVIYAAYQKYPSLYQTVDIVIWRHLKDEPLQILLGRKKNDLPNKWRFIGGFVDIKDESLERAAQREASEETNMMAIHPPQYAFSHRVDDWRYRKEQDGIMTAVFFAKYFYGATIAGDDLNEIAWFEVDKINEDKLVPDHSGMWQKVKEKFDESTTRE